ncbi:MAG: hypothetical protein ACLQMS_17340 [Desulfomonilaceae bacterium]
MEMSYCANCGKDTGHKLALGFGTFFAFVEKWSNGLVQLSVTFKCKLLVHAATLCLGRVPQ